MNGGVPHPRGTRVAPFPLKRRTWAALWQVPSSVGNFSVWQKRGTKSQLSTDASMKILGGRSKVSPIFYPASSPRFLCLGVMISSVKILKQPIIRDAQRWSSKNHPSCMSKQETNRWLIYIYICILTNKMIIFEKHPFFLSPQYFKLETQVPCVENGSICGASKGFANSAEPRGF